MDQQHSEETHIQIDSELLVNNDLNTENIKCPICHNIYYEPMACGNCLNHFCSYCIHSSIKYTKRCPLCQQNKEIRRAVPLLRNMLAQLNLHCINRSNGCNQIIQYDAYAKHLDECPYQMDVCLKQYNGARCGQRMLRLQLEEHQNKLCPFRPAVCSHCSINLIQRDIEAHSEICPKYPIICQKCKELTTRGDEKLHLVECTQNYVVCAYCHETMLYKQLIQHEPECEMRQVSCMGCHQSMELRHYYKHQGECSEFPMMCPNCKERLPRHQFLVHSLQNCLANIRTQFTDEIQKLKDELQQSKTELEFYKKGKYEEMMYLMSLEQQSSFSRKMKDSDVFISLDRKTATVREQKKKRRDRFALLVKPLDLNQEFSCSFKLNVLKSEWFAVGITDGSSIYLSSRYQELGHGSYLVSANGIIYSSHNPLVNCQASQFRMEQGDIIRIQYSPEQKQLLVTNLLKDIQQNLSIDLDVAKPYYPCVCLRAGTDSATILD